MFLLEYISNNIDKLLEDWRPYLCDKVATRELYSDQLLKVRTLWVVSDDDELFGTCHLRDWTFDDGIVLRTNAGEETCSSVVVAPSWKSVGF